MYKLNNQPDANSITLNRVIGGSTSQIYGNLIANGQVWLLNSAGVYFSPQAHVNVAGLLATVHDINTEDFMAGHYQFEQSPLSLGSIINEGTLIANSGLIALVAPHITNTGHIIAQLGHIILASSHTYTIDFYGDGLINFALTTPSTISSTITNQGTLIANGGRILLSTHTAENILNNTINNTGLIQAQTINEHQGQITLDSGPQGQTLITNQGQLDVSGLQMGESAGTIYLIGQKVGLLDQSTLNANAYHNAGRIYVGGQAHGESTFTNAEYTYIAPQSTLSANATQTGQGGEIIVWSNQGTQFYGTLTATSQQQQGGFAEVSGLAHLDFNPLVPVNLQSLAGDTYTGTLLLDPYNLTIKSGTGRSNTTDASCIIWSVDAYCFC